MDGPPPPDTRLPPWLDASLIRELSDLAAADLAAGLPRARVAQRTMEAGLAHRPALPVPQIREAVEVALWVAGVAD